MFVPEFSFVYGAGYFIDCPSQPERYFFWRACVSHTKTHLLHFVGFLFTERFSVTKTVVFTSAGCKLSIFFISGTSRKTFPATHSVFSQTSEFSPCHINICNLTLIASLTVVVVFWPLQFYTLRCIFLVVEEDNSYHVKPECVNDRIRVKKNDLQVSLTLFGNFDLEKLFAMSSEFQATFDEPASVTTVQCLQTFCSFIMIVILRWSVNT